MDDRVDKQPLRQQLQFGISERPPAVDDKTLPGGNCGPSPAIPNSPAARRISTATVSVTPGAASSLRLAAPPALPPPLERLRERVRQQLGGQPLQVRHVQVALEKVKVAPFDARDVDIAERHASAASPADRGSSAARD